MRWLNQARVKDLILKRTSWIKQKLRIQSETVLPKPKEYVSGENFTYLGRNYRLKLIPNGEEEAEIWAKALVANLARKPEGNDRAQVKAIHEGVCDLAVINTYYFGKMKFNEKDTEQKNWAKAINLIFINQQDRGNHINVAGGGVVKYSKNKENAIALLEFLTQPNAQALYATMNYEYPVNPLTELSNELKSWGRFKEDQLPVEKLAELAPIAQKIIDRVGW